MTGYAFWNNKGGVGKSFLCFVAASEYAHRHPEADVYVVDLCPQANVSEILLGGYPSSSQPLEALVKSTPRATVAGYLEARLNSPFRMVDDVGVFLAHPSEANAAIPANLWLVCGDNLVELLAEAIRQTSQLAIPTTAWGQVLCWVRDLVGALRVRSGDRDSVFLFDCNPSFAIYTQLALVAAESVIVPLTADDSSRRAVENVVALLYGVGDPHTAVYARINFAKRAQEENLPIPRLHSFVSNRVTQYEGKASKAFEAVSKAIRKTMDEIHSRHRSLFASPSGKPSRQFLEVPDYHSACIISSTTGTPLHRLTAGPKNLLGERVQINKEPLDRYRSALARFVDRL